MTWCTKGVSQPIIPLLCLCCLGFSTQDTTRVTSSMLLVVIIRLDKIVFYRRRPSRRPLNNFITLFVFVFQVSCAFTLLAAVAAAVASSPSSSDGQKSVVVSSSGQQPYQVPAAVVPYPGQNYQIGSEYVSPFAKSAYSPKVAPPAVPSSFGKLLYEYKKNRNCDNRIVNVIIICNKQKT